MGVEVSEVINILGERYDKVFQGTGLAIPEHWLRFWRSPIYVLESKELPSWMFQFFIFIVM